MRKFCPILYHTAHLVYLTHQIFYTFPHNESKGNAAFFAVQHHRHHADTMQTLYYKTISIICWLCIFCDSYVKHLARKSKKIYIHYCRESITIIIGSFTWQNWTVIISVILHTKETLVLHIYNHNHLTLSFVERLLLNYVIMYAQISLLLNVVFINWEQP